MLIYLGQWQYLTQTQQILIGNKLNIQFKNIH